MKSESNYCSETAILFFAQREFEESISKPITCQNRQSIMLWRKMNERALKTIKKTNLPFFISDEACQNGNTFGDKLSGAISKVFARGYEKVIVIGNDCPKLKCDHLLEASAKLKTTDAVLGADFKGGVYLIGVSRVSFNTKAFSAVSWQTSTVFNELRLHFNNCSCSFLSRLNDFNCRSELNEVLRNLSFSDSFRSLLMSLTQKIIVDRDREYNPVSSELIAFNHNKGSPFAI